MKAITIIAILFLYVAAGAGTTMAADSHVDSVSATTANGRYNAGDTIAITVTFSRSETVSTSGGIPRIQLAVGGATRYANYLSGTGTKTLTFNYVVVAGDTSSDLNYVATNSLYANGGTIRNGGTDATLTLPGTSNSNSLGRNKNIIIDTTPPNTTINSETIGDGSAIFEFSSTETGSTFECRLDGSGSTGYSSCNSPKSYSGIADGSHIFYVKADDAAGNTDPTPASYIWTVDNTPPTTTIDSKTISGSSASFTFSSTESGTFQCQLDGSAFSPCSSPKSYSGLGDGNHTFYVKANDTFGNTGNIASYTWLVDITAPNTIIDSNTISGGSAIFEFSSTETGSTFRCKLDTDDYKNCDSGKIGYSGLQFGSHIFSVKAKKDGKYDLTPATYTWVVEVNKPDGDHDGLSDDDEDNTYHTNKYDSDSDNDGVNDGLEIEHETDPNDSDSDCDDVKDGDEDSDGDGERDGDEFGDREHERIDDSDADEVDNEYEDEHETDKYDDDSDHDSIKDGQEDRDGDGLTDKEESQYNTNPKDSDSDDDGRDDGEEIGNHDGSNDETDPNDSDSDDDGLNDGEDLHPNDSDSDDDGMNDGDEKEGHEHHINTCHETQIPEFPSIALPIAATLGLLFVMRRKIH